MPTMFDGFTEFDLHLGDNVIHGRHGGQGPPLLLHGIPQTHLMWGSVAIAPSWPANRSR